MSKIQNEHFVLEDNCIVKCKEAGKIVVLPAAIDGHRVKRVGQDLDFVTVVHKNKERTDWPEKNVLWPDNNEIEAVVVEEGVEELKPFWFIGLKNIKELYLPFTVKSIGNRGVGNNFYRDVCIYVERDLKESEYENLLSNSKRMENGRYLLLNSEINIPSLMSIHRSLHWRYESPKYLNQQLGCMISEHAEFSSDRQAFIRSDKPFDRYRDFYSFFDIGDIEVIDPETKEFTADFIKMLIERKPTQIEDKEVESGVFKWWSAPSDELVDPYACTTLVSFDEQEIQKTDKGYRVCLMYHRGCAGVPIIKPAVVNGKTYYVLYVYYLRVVDDIPLSRKFVGVYLENGQPASKNVVSQIYKDR